MKVKYRVCKFQLLQYKLVKITDEDRLKDVHSTFYQTINNSNDGDYSKQSEFRIFQNITGSFCLPQIPLTYF